MSRTSRRRRLLGVLMALGLMVPVAVTAPAGADSGTGGQDELQLVELIEVDPEEQSHRKHGGITDGPVSQQQHGDMEGHLPGSSRNVELVGQVTMSDVVPGRIADVGALGDYAYLGAFNIPCGAGGVYIVDIADPTDPTEVGFIPTGLGSYVGEGVQAITVDTPQFQGDILMFTNEICGLSDEQVGGFSLWDVTDPLNPEPLVEGFGDSAPFPGAFSTAHQSHSGFIWQQGERVFVVTVDNEEFEDIDIFDVTDPSNPVMVAETGILDWPSVQDEQAFGIGDFPASFHHDVVVKQLNNRWVMLVSYWDAGYLTLDVTNPENPTLITDSTFPDPDSLLGHSPPEGNAHQAELNHSNRYVVAADEDFSPTTMQSFTSNAFEGSRPAVESEFSPLIVNMSNSTWTAADVVHVGRGCPADPATGLPVDDPYLADPAGKVALIERGVCRFDNKVARAQLAGATGVIVYNNAAGGEGLILMGGEHHVVEGGPGVIGVDIAIPAVFVQHSTGLLLIGGTPPVSTTAVTEFNGWGYLRLFDARTLEEIDAYAIPEALDPAYASGFGDLSVHEVALDPDSNLAYVSYYAGGFRVLKFGAAGMREVGHYIHEDGNNFWGVQVHDPTDDPEDRLILASDRDSGLWIFRFTGRP